MTSAFQGLFLYQDRIVTAISSLVADITNFKFRGYQKPIIGIIHL